MSAWRKPLNPGLAPAAQGNRQAAPGALRQHIDRWWLARHPPSDSVTLTQRTVYILPSRPGLMLAVTVFLLLIASINYQLNLGYLFTFLLAGSALVGMHVCHGNLRGLHLRLAPPAPQFAASAVALDVQLASSRNSPRYAIGLAVQGSGHWAWCDVPAQGASSVQIGFTPTQRGLQSVPALTAETRFPLGSFRVWTVWRPAAQVLVYPAPEPHPPALPPGVPRAGGTGAGTAQDSGEFDGVRAYRRGDPMKLVVWKKLAKADELVSRDSVQAQRHEPWLDFAQLGALEREAKLSRLCAWVLMADRLGLDYGLRLPGLDVAPACGEAHKRRCLEGLALC